MTIRVAILPLLFAPLLAAQSVSELLDKAVEAAPGDHAGWIAVRDKLVAKGDAAVPALAAASADDQWTESGWVRAMAAEAARLRILHPETVAVIDNPPGINPEVYREFRKPAPGCVQELSHPGKEFVPLLLERWHWTLDARPFSKGEAGMAERNALAHALLYVPGFHADTRARFAMLAALKDKALPDAWRRDAAVSYGQTGGVDAIVELCAIIDDAAHPKALRETCCYALGRVADDKAFDAMESRLANEVLAADEAFVRALLLGVGTLGSRGGWQARGAMVKEQGERIREKCARLLVMHLESHPALAEHISQQLQSVAYDESLAWVKQLAKEGKTEQAREAAKGMIDTLALAISRYK
ncbi:MAG: hypothetical protein KF696_08210 [Planctomycetes bacterium]|nr:hypothetical protein [Planctomycetota bacterium]MCW8135666.1 hypothetical protein [Planctomycetota bacterium]